MPRTIAMLFIALTIYSSATGQEIVSRDGNFVTLDDGAAFSVDAWGTLDAALWMPGDEIRISDNFCLEATNLDDGSSASIGWLGQPAYRYPCHCGFYYGAPYGGGPYPIYSRRRFRGSR